MIKIDIVEDYIICKFACSQIKANQFALECKKILHDYTTSFPGISLITWTRLPYFSSPIVLRDVYNVLAVGPKELANWKDYLVLEQFENGSFIVNEKQIGSKRFEGTIKFFDRKAAYGYVLT